MAPQGGGRVQFDFEGSLQLARMLWSLAEELSTEDTTRNSKAETALAKWAGPYGTEFAERRSTEATSRQAVVEGLRRDASAWAESWAIALDQQNKNNRAAKVTELREGRSGWEKFSDKYLWTEDTSEQDVRPVPEVTTPVPPNFHPTATETHF